MRSVERRFLVAVCVAVVILASVPVVYEYAGRAGVKSKGGLSPPPNSGNEPWYLYVKGLVNVANGNLFLSEDDLHFRALGHEISFSHSYNSIRASHDGPLGYGWTHSYNLYLVVTATGGVEFHDGDGSKHLFTNVNGSFSPPPGTHMRLTQNGTGLFTLWEKDGTTLAFNNYSHVSIISDKNGNNLTFSYSNETNPKLESVKDDSGLFLNLSYSGSGITEISDPINRSVRFYYDNKGNLEAITDPMGNNTTHTYSNKHMMLSWYDRMKRTRIFDYDKEDRIIEIGLAENSTTPWAKTTIDYASSPLVQITNENNHKTNITIDSEGRPTKVEGSIYADRFDAFMYSAQYGYGEPFDGPRIVCGPKGCSRPSCTWPCSGPLTDLFVSRIEQFNVTWDDGNNIVSIEEPDGDVHSFSFDSLGNLLNYTDPSANSTKHQWTNKVSGSQYIALLSNTTDPRGFHTSFDYDKEGNLENVTDSLGNVSRFYYDARGNHNKTVDFRGYATTFEFDAHGYQTNMTDGVNGSTTYVYDGIGRGTKRTTPMNLTTEYEYDKNSRIIKQKDPSGNSTVFTYNARGDLISILDAEGGTKSFGINVTLRKIESITDSSGNYTTYSYNWFGNPISKTNAKSQTTSYVYDYWERLSLIQDALGNETKYSYNADGTLASITDWNNQTTSFAYDGTRRVTKMTDSMNHEFITAYDENGNVISRTDARGFTTEFSVDGLGRLVAIEDPLGNSTKYEYDENGNLVKLTDTSGNATSFGYDALNRRTFVSDPYGWKTNYTYDADGRIVAIEDALGHGTNYTYDALGRLTCIEDAKGVSNTFTYNAVGRLMSVTDGNNHTTTYGRDSNGRLQNITTPLGKKWTFLRDNNGNIISQTDPKGSTSNYTFDGLDRVIRVDYSDGSNTTFEYDATSALVAISGFGYSQEIERDSLGRPTNVTYDFGTFEMYTIYSYDNSSNRISMEDSLGNLTNYSYDALNRMTSIVENDNETWTFQYDSRGLRTMTTYPNGLYVNFTYDKMGRILNISGFHSNATLFVSRDYTYDRMSNIVKMVDSEGNTTIYAYDAIYELTSVFHPSGDYVNYTYDGAGNRLTEVLNSSLWINSTYDADDRITAQGNTTLGWDDNGNMIWKNESGDISTYGWDPKNRLSSVTLKGNMTLNFTYDALWSLVSASVNSTKEYYYYDCCRPDRYRTRVYDINSSGEVVSRYTGGPQTDEILGKESVSGGTSYSITDAIMSSIALVDGQGDQVESRSYDPWGKSQSGYSHSIFPFGFTSRPLPAQGVEVYNLRARWYDPDLGRFISRDPIKSWAARSFYEYARNNPMTLVDPSGLTTRGSFYVITASEVLPRPRIDIGCRQVPMGEQGNPEPLCGGSPSHVIWGCGFQCRNRPLYNCCDWDWGCIGEKLNDWVDPQDPLNSLIILCGAACLGCMGPDPTKITCLVCFGCIALFGWNVIDIFGNCCREGQHKCYWRPGYGWSP